MNQFVWSKGRVPRKPDKGFPSIVCTNSLFSTSLYNYCSWGLIVRYLGRSIFARPYFWYPQLTSMLCYEKFIFQKKVIAQAKDWIRIISTLHSEILMIWIPLLEYYIDSHYSLLFESRVFKGLNIYWPSTVVIFLSLLASELIFVASSDHSLFHSKFPKVPGELVDRSCQHMGSLDG